VSKSLRELPIPELCRLISIAVERLQEANCSTRESPLLSLHLCHAFDALNQAIDALTSEQLKVLNFLGHSKRVRISGCAGSGKTLVAAEKACRLDAAGLRVLVLCHSPYLARYISTLLLGTGVDVESFDAWLHKYLGDPPSTSDEARWTHTHKPNDKEIDEAFDAIVNSRRSYDAIIVDEAQDFRPEWWVLVEAALAEKAGGFLYIFHDDKQQLDRKYVPDYPIAEPHLDLSRNIRNSGNVYKVVKYYNRASPPIEEELSGMGNAVALYLPFPDPALCLQVALCRVRQHYPGSDRILLICSETTVTRSGVHSGSAYEVAAVWQEAIFVQLLRLIESLESLDASQKLLWRHRLDNMCAAMSVGREPAPSDVRLVNRFVASLPISALEPSNVRWAVQEHQLHIRTGAAGTEHIRKCVGLLRKPNWHKFLPIAHFRSLAKDDIIVVTPGSAKGLEADVVVMMVEQYDAYTETEYYIAISRARHSVFFVLTGKEHSLPRGIRENLVDYYQRISTKP
jgi:hypothetical protein